MTTTRPPFAYYGGKTKLAPQIAALLPAHDHYVEPFAGSLAVLLAKPASKMETINDLDSDLITFWRVLRDQPEELERAILLTPHSRAELDVAKSHTTDDLEQARRVFTLLMQSRSNSMQPTGWRYGSNANARHPLPKILKGATARLAASAARITNVSLENRDAIDIINNYGQEPTVCIYADPPYLGDTRSGTYRHEMLEDEMHDRLAEALNDCRASVVLSGFDSPLYVDLFDGWHRVEMEAPTNLAGAQGQNEILWSNVPLGDDTLFNI